MLTLRHRHDKQNVHRKKNDEFPAAPKEFCTLGFSNIFHGFKNCLGKIMGVSKNRGILPPKWTVHFMEHPIFEWMIWGKKPLFLETPIYYKRVLNKNEANQLIWVLPITTSKKTSSIPRKQNNHPMKPHQKWTFQR